MKFVSGLGACILSFTSAIISPPSHSDHFNELSDVEGKGGKPNKGGKPGQGKMKLSVDDEDMGKTPKDVILFMGQSNCQGQAELADVQKLDPSYLKPTKNMLGTPYRKIDEINWIQYGPRFSKSDENFGNKEGSFGAELSFGRHIAPMYKDDAFAVKKICVSSTSLAEDWLKHYNSRLVKNGEPLVSRAVEWIHLLNKSDGCVEGRCRLKAIVWIQGEDDAINPEMSAKYEQNLAKLFQIVRGEAKDPKLPIFILELPSTGWTAESYSIKGATEVREAQAAYVKSDKRAVLIPGIDMSNLEDKHYNAEMQIELGRCLADSFRDYFS